MRLLLTLVLVGLAVVCSARPAEEDYAYEDDAPAEVAPAPSTKAPARHGLNSRTARGPSPLIGSRGAKTTAAPPKPAEPEVVNEPEEVDEEVGVENEEVVAVTTEAPKKGLMRGVVRPFRSNQDLLAALKRKRQQEHNSGGVSTHPPASATTATPAEPKPNSKGASSRSNSNNNSSSGRRTFSRPNKATPAASEAGEDAETASKKPAFPSSSSRRFSGRGKAPVAPAPVSEDPEGDEPEEPTPRAAKTFRGGRRV